MADHLHLVGRHRRVIQALLWEYLPGVEAWAFGSRVNGVNDDDSDRRLLLRGPELEKIAAENLANFEKAARESTILFSVEAQDWARLSKQFQRDVECCHVVWREIPPNAKANT